MRFHNIEKDSMLNGEGIRTVLWLSGCNHFCDGCQNPVTWNPNDGIIFDGRAEEELFRYLDKDYCSGLTLSGGDPMFPDNRDDVLKLCQHFRQRYGNNKTIWLYTGYTMAEIADSNVLEYVDVVVDGEFQKDKKNINYMWAGSTNQRIWRKIDGKFEPDEPTFSNSLSEAASECERG